MPGASIRSIGNKCRLAPLFASITSRTISRGRDSDNRLTGDFTRVKPTVLLACAFRWLPPSRLAMALAEAGFVVDAVCPWRHSLTTLRSSIRRTYTHSGFSAEESFESAIIDSKPDLIVPCDDVTVRHLHRLHAKHIRRGNHSGIADRIEHSLGLAENFPILYRRADFIQIAKEQGIRTPAARDIADEKDLRDWLQQHGFPTVLKADDTSAGEGVRIVEDQSQAQKAFALLAKPPLVARALKRALIDQDSSLVRRSLLRSGAHVSAQSFVGGREATSLVACWKGKVLASLHFEVLNKTNATGYSTVLRFVENAEMESAADKIVRRLGLSGINGFDFILEAETGNAYLIEINPRATQIGHLTLGPGRDIPGALFSCVTGRPIQEAAKVTDKDVVALFPQEWKRDPHSCYLGSGYHDVPWSEPELIRACVRPQRRQWKSFTEKEASRGLSPARVSRS